MADYLMVDMLYPPNIASAVADAWHVLNEQLRRHSFPDNISLVKILDTAYATGLMVEELRPLKIRLAYANDKELCNIELKHYRFSWMPFESTRPLNPAELRRIAPSLNPENTMLCIRNKNATELEIFGILSCPNNLRKMRSGEAFSGYGFPDLFNVLSDGPGRLSSAESLNY